MLTLRDRSRTRPSRTVSRIGSSRVRAACVLLILSLTTSRASSSLAEEQGAKARVVLFGAPLELARALRTALTPWGMTVELDPDASQAAGLQTRPERAHAIADRRSAAALIWLERAPSGLVLWSFDVTKNTTTARDVPTLKLDQPVSAALALSVKTHLLAPEVSALSVPAAPASALGAQPPPSVDVQPLSSHAPTGQLVVLAALRRGALAPSATEPRYALELRWAPGSTSATALAEPWVGARFDVGGKEDVSGTTFRGQYSEIGAGVLLGVTRRLSPSFSAGAQLAFTLHSASLAGIELPDAPLAQQSPWGSAVHLRPEMGLSLGAIGLVIQPALGATLRRHSFSVNEREVLQTRPVWWMLGAGVSVSIE